ncbi:hypothetical protein JHK84_040338 [Glycine max]|nr:hypothetical protein JHK86_040122 [Glycine max]KAG4965730.1 hypothetical protein JHK85_040705 [Glycine max]KAG5121998.1 hypothetical protein JHK84_040338 [Glycine max]
MPSDWRQRQQVGIMSLLRPLDVCNLRHHILWPLGLRRRQNQRDAVALAALQDPAPVAAMFPPWDVSLWSCFLLVLCFLPLAFPSHVENCARRPTTSYTVEMESRFDISLHSIFFSLILSKGSAYRKDKALTVLRAQGRQATTKLEMQGISTIGKGPKRH